MSSDTARQIAESARKFTDPAERAAYLDRVCRGIVRLREDVDRILAAGPLPVAEPETREDERFAASPPPRIEFAATPATTPTPDAPASSASPGIASAERAGDRIDRFRLVRELGAGGFGTVWLAEQTEPVRRQVALKIIKLGMDTEQVVARFEQERQALALMDHPHVARVLDAGATAAGRPYFAMDLVQGEPIHEFCDRERLTIEQRLALFQQVCAAVQHAHMKGIIHRDLKPSNILVGSRDGAPHATVIDFGIAKATSSRLTERSLMTEAYQVIGTLQYMSPEQAQASPDIDTRTDVYSLGVILYELLVGSTPFEKKTFERAALAEIQRKIREDDPAPPSSRISSTRELLPELAEKRRTDAARLSSLLHGELDWIVMKAIEKERARRYESAEAFAADIRRYLAGDAVLAAPPSTGYLLKKLLRRHRGLVAASGAVAAALVAGIIAFAWQANVAGTERDDAVKARESEAAQRRIADEQRDRALKAETEAKTRADELKIVADFQAGMLEQIDATEAGIALTADVEARFAAALEKAGIDAAELAAERAAFGRAWRHINATDAARAVIEKTILEPAIAAIDRKFAAQPLIDAQLRQALAERYMELGSFSRAEALLSRVVEIRRRELGDDAPETLYSLQKSGEVLFAAGRYAEAEPFLRNLVERRVKVSGEDSGEVAETRHTLATVLRVLGRDEESETLARQALAWRERVLGPKHATTISTLSVLAGVVQARDRFDEAAAIFADALARATDGVGPDHPETLALVNNLGTLEQARGRLDVAERHFRDLLGRRERVSGEDHPNTLIALGNLGFVLREQGRLDEAEPYIRASLERRRRTLGDDHPATLYALSDVGALLVAQKRPAEAEPCFRQAWEGRRRIYGDANEVTRASLVSLASLLASTGRAAESNALHTETLERVRAKFGPDHLETIRTLHTYGAHLMLTDPREAEKVLRDTVERATRTLGPASFPAVDATGGLAGMLARRDRPGEGAKILREFLALNRDAAPKDLLPLMQFLPVVANKLMDRNLPKVAEQLLREEVRVRRAAQGDDDRATFDAMNRLGTCLQRQEARADEAETFMRQAYEGRLRVLGPDHPETLVSVHNMWVVLHELKRWADAEPFCRRDLEELSKPGVASAPGRAQARAEAIEAMGQILMGLGRPADAEVYLREHLELVRKTSGAARPEAIHPTRLLAEAILAAGRPAEAEPLVRDILPIVDREAGRDSPYATECRNLLGTILWQQRKFDAAIEIYTDLAARLPNLAGPNHVVTLAAEFNLAINLRDAGRTADALARFEDAARRSAAGDPAVVAQAAGFVFDHAKAYLAAGQPDRALQFLRDSVAASRRRHPPESLALAQDLVTQAVAFLEARAWGDAETLLREAIAVREKLEPDAWSTFNAKALLGEALLGTGQFAAAEPLVTSAFEQVLARESKIPPSSRQWIDKGRARILRLYTEWTAAEPGKGHDAKLEAWRAKLAPPPATAPR